MKVELESNYNIGDEVYIPSDEYDTAMKCTVKTVMLSYSTDINPHDQFRYCVTRSDNKPLGMYCEFRVFQTKEECLKYCDIMGN